MLFKNNQYIALKDILLILACVVWATVNVYLLPFSVWTAGITRPWYMLHGYVPYRDFTWIRMPFDLFFLSGWYAVLGANAHAYQFFVFTLFLIIIGVLYFISRSIKPELPVYSLLFFSIFLFPLFLNTEEGEMIIGLLQLLVFSSMFFYLKKQNIAYLIIGGLLSGLSFITKQNTVFLIGAVFLCFVFDAYSKKTPLFKALTRLIIYIIGFFIPLTGVMIYFIYHHGVEDFLYYTFFIVLGPYRNSVVTQGDGLWIVAGYIALLIPLLFLWRRIPLIASIKLFIIFQIFSLFPSLLPSYLSYRAFTMFPLIAIVFGLYCSVIYKKNNNITSVKKIFTGILFISFIFLIYRFFPPYISTIQDNGFRKDHYITDYGQAEREVANIIKNKSPKGEKIMNYGSEMIYILADRLPKNKYTDPFPYVLSPYKDTSKVFFDNPPKLVVYDISLPEYHPGLADWPFLDFLKNHYKIIGRFENNLVLYEYSSLVSP